MNAQKQKSITEILGLTFIFLVLAYLYTYPGGDYLLDSVKNKVLGDGTDSLTLPFQYGLVKYLALNHPFDLLFGALPAPFTDAPDGSAMFMCWIEKILAVIALPLVSLEQMSTLMVWMLMLINAFSAYAMARTFKWPKPVCVAVAICWAFNPFTRARAKVHTAMTGIFFLPMIFVGLNLVRKHSDRKSLIWAGFAFWVAALSPQYFLLMAAFLSPLYLVYVFWGMPQEQWTKLGTRLVIAALPAVIFTGFTYLKPLPPSMVKPGVLLKPATGDFKDPSGVHPFLKRFAARPIDYFAGDVGIGMRDWNPLRYEINKEIYSNMNESNPHERANGGRWTVIALFIAALILISKKSNHDRFAPTLRRDIYFFAIFAAAGFLLSLSPDVAGGSGSPAAILHGLVPQFRVPARASLFFHFGALVVAGFIATELIYSRRVSNRAQKLAKKGKELEAQEIAEEEGWTVRPTKWAKRLAIPFVLPAIAVIDLPPMLNPMPTAPVFPAYENMTGPSSKNCGNGFYFPYVSHDFAMKEMYIFLQRLRGSECHFLNGNQNQVRNQALLRNFALHPQIVEPLKRGEPIIRTRLIMFAQCVPLDWIIFDQQVPLPWAQDVCRELGWTWSGIEVCRNPAGGRPMQKLPEQCLGVQ